MNNVGRDSSPVLTGLRLDGVLRPVLQQNYVNTSNLVYDLPIEFFLKPRHTPESIEC